MDPSELRRIRSGHNGLAWAKAGGYFLLAAVTWFLSWWAMWLIIAVLSFLWGGFASLKACSWIAWGGTALLSIEGVRYHRRLFDLDAYSRSMYCRAFSFEDPPRARAWRRGGDPLVMSYLISQFLLSAPRATVNVLRSLRSRVPMDEETLARAAAVTEKLRAKKGWMQVAELGDEGEALLALDRLKIIWTEAKDGVVQVRLDPDYVPQPAETDLAS